MSSRNINPHEKQDTTSNSNESNSDVDIDETEEDMGGLKIEESLAKENLEDGSDESKQLEFPNQEIIASSKDNVNASKAGPSGLQKPRQSSLDSSSSDAKSKYFPVSRLGKCTRAKVFPKDLRVEMTRADTDTSDSMSPPCSLSPPILPLKQARIVSSTNSRDKKKLPIREVLRPFFGSSQKSSSIRRGIYAADSANTSSDVSEIPSEIADLSAEESVYHDAPENLEREDTPSFKSALEQQNSESSDISISEIQEDSIPLSSSVSISTNSGEGGYRNFIEECQRAAEEFLEISTSSGIGITDESEMENLQQWVEGQRFPIQNVDNTSDSQNPSNSDRAAQAEESQPTSEPMEEQFIGEDQGILDFDRLFQRNEENSEEAYVPEQVCRKNAASSIPKCDESVSVSNIGAGTSYQASQSKYTSDSSSGPKDCAGKLRLGPRPSSGKRNKATPQKSKYPLESSSESPEPKSTSSDDSRRKESPELSSSESSKKLFKHQGAGKLRSTHFSTMSSIEDVKEEERISSSNNELMETKDPTPERMQTTFEENNKPIAAATEQSDSEPSVLESSHQTSEFEAERAIKKQMERKAGKSTRREAKLSTSPPSDQNPGSSPRKTAKLGPQKKVKPEAESVDTSGNSNVSLPKKTSTISPEQSGSSTTSESDDESPDDKSK